MRRWWPKRQRGGVVKKRGHHRHPLASSEVYPEQFTARGTAWMRPSPADLGDMQRIILDELVTGVVNPVSTGCFQGVVQRMKNEGCDAVLLGCTDIALLISDANSALPPLDSTRLLAQAALQRAVHGLVT